MYRLLFWSCLPFVVPQALWVRKTAPRFADAAGPATGFVGASDSAESERRLIAVGDSIVAGVGAPTLEEALVGRLASALAGRLASPVGWQAIGRTGTTSERLLALLPGELPSGPADVVLLNVGVNDLTRITTTRRFLANIHALYDLLRQRYPGALVAINGLPPLGLFPLLPQPLRAVLGLRAAIFNRELARAVAGMPGAVFVPVEFDAEPDSFADDGFHPSAVSYGLFAEHVMETILEAGVPPLRPAAERRGDARTP